MRRGFWFVAGAGAGVYAATRVRRAAEMFTVDGARDRLHGLGLGARLMREEYVAGAVATETALRERLGLVPDGTKELGSGGGLGFETVAARPPQPAATTQPAAVNREKDSN